MKISLALGPRQRLNRQSAWGCFTTNLALPGFGSLMAGRISGYPQVILALGGFLASTAFTARFFTWYLANRSALHSDEADPLATLVALWRHVRWPLLGIGLFALGWLWALLTSWQILQDSKHLQPPKLPAP